MLKAIVSMGNRQNSPENQPRQQATAFDSKSIRRISANLRLSDLKMRPLSLNLADMYFRFGFGVAVGPGFVQD
jgi:hypothetical protein